MVCVCVCVRVRACVCVCVCVCVAKPVAVELRCHATALIEEFFHTPVSTRFPTYGNNSKFLDGYLSPNDIPVTFYDINFHICYEGLCKQTDI